MDIYRKQLVDAGINSTRALEIALAVDKLHAALSRSDNSTRRVICETLSGGFVMSEQRECEVCQDLHDNEFSLTCTACDQERESGDLKLEDE